MQIINELHETTIEDVSKLDQEKRFYEIDQNISTTGYEILHTYFYFSKTGFGNVERIL